jgi:signal transduction histidine kinase
MPNTSNERRYRGVLLLGAGLVTLLILLTVLQPPASFPMLPALLFWLLMTFTLTVGIPFAGGEVSLQPMAVCATYLVLGLVPAAWVVLLSTVAHGWIRRRRARRSGDPAAQSDAEILNLTILNAAMHVPSILLGGVVYRWMGASSPLDQVTLGNLLPLLSLGLTYLGANYGLAALYIALWRGRAALASYVGVLGDLLLYEGGPLLFAPLTALTYTCLGPIHFVSLAALMVISSLIAQGLAQASRRLERRVQELSSLQAVGQALSASLDIDAIVSAIYEQVTRLMPAPEFYVALYDAETDEVSFPLAVEQGRRVQWRPRRRGRGLTEYVLQSREPLLIRHDVEQRVRELGMEMIGSSAACWLGVPMLAGGEALGIIALQSLTTANVYDTSHLEVLHTIAAQAAVAIQNARLYTRTDEALARRVQELNSVLRTTAEGMLLLDLDWNVLAVNRALADFLGMAQLDLARNVSAMAQGGEPSLISRVHYTPEQLRADCEALAAGRIDHQEHAIVVGDPPIHLARTLTPVRDAEGAINGWLLVFHDITEEVELNRMREEMTDMLVHDLRSPLTMVMGSIGLMQRAWNHEDAGEFQKLITLAQGSNERILRMINQLLDISRFESGNLPLHCQSVSVEQLLRDVIARHAPAAATVDISLEMEVDVDLPPLHVDRQLVGRVLDNLLDNAVKFTPEGGSVHVWARRAPQTSWLHIGVSDTGPGIPSEGQAHLFEKFQQVKGIEGRRRGSGLGLHFCKLVVEAHEGEIWVESEMGQGSTFVVSLPSTEGHHGTD